MATMDDKVNQSFFIDAARLRSILRSYKTLINHFETALPSAVESPIRHSHQTSPSSSLLLMPSFSLSASLPYIGVKLVTYHPSNSSLNLPVIHANYTLFSSITGQPLASMDGSELTLYRTACVSALASQYLSRTDSKTLVMIGAGSLAPHLIRAHLSARPSLNKVIIWNRTVQKAETLAEMLGGEFEGVSFESNGCLDDVVRVGDIVSCATNSEVALVMGKNLKIGAHLDLVGSFKPSMKECDDEAIRRGRVFVDNEAALVEAGELLGAFERGVISRDEIVGNLVELIRGEKVGRREEAEITIFKSVGSAKVDLLCAQLVYETYNNAPGYSGWESSSRKSRTTCSTDNLVPEDIYSQSHMNSSSDSIFSSTHSDFSNSYAEEERPKKKYKKSSKSSTNSQLEDKMINVLDLMVQNNAGPSLQKCKEKLNKLGWGSKNTLHQMALGIFCESATYRTQWMLLEEDENEHWIKMVSAKLGFNV